MELDNTLKSRREEIMKIAAKHGACNVRIFGSLARGEAGENSDIDFLVELERAGVSWICPSWWWSWRIS
ncbi:MAG TPA: nucleotidyltransferase domain-containing protein [Methanothrix sp.]|jgi:predicted nucleotidyltransferase|nr:nucleotidyltransferase domain-containing protein [Methanothrix sp.]